MASGRICGKVKAKRLLRVGGRDGVWEPIGAGSTGFAAIAEIDRCRRVLREQCETLFAALRSHLNLPLALGYYAGMCQGEILGLEWNPVDLLIGVARYVRARRKTTKRGRSQSFHNCAACSRSNPRRGRQAASATVSASTLRAMLFKIGGFRKASYTACVETGLGIMEAETDEKGERVDCDGHSHIHKPVMRAPSRGGMMRTIVSISGAIVACVLLAPQFCFAQTQKPSASSAMPVGGKMTPARLIHMEPPVRRLSPLKATLRESK